MFVNKEICTKCKGLCCKTIPGCSAPSDFGDTDEQIKKKVIYAIHSKKYSIDCWEGLIDEYFIRPATKGDYKRLDRSWGGECIFLTDQGCSLFPARRPYGCQQLEPTPNGCIPHTNKKDAAELWKPYHTFIESLI